MFLMSGAGSSINGNGTLHHSKTPIRIYHFFCIGAPAPSKNTRLARRRVQRMTVRLTKKPFRRLVYGPSIRDPGKALGISLVSCLCSPMFIVAQTERRNVLRCVSAVVTVYLHCACDFLCRVAKNRAMKTDYEIIQNVCIGCQSGACTP